MWYGKLSRDLVLALALTGTLALTGALAPNVCDAQTIFRYSFSDTLPLPVIEDASGMGNDALAGSLASLSSEVPGGSIPGDAGDRSLDSSDPTVSMADQSGAVTIDTLLLSNTEIANAGGFTMECWLRWNGGGTVNSIIDYAGTEKLVIEGGILAMRFSDGVQDIPFGTPTVDEWHYVAAVFDTEGAAVDAAGALTGTVYLYWDDSTLLSSTPGVTKSAFGDSLNRSIGIGQHPLGFVADFFDGRVFEPRVSFGPLQPDELLISTSAGPEFDRGDANSDGGFDIPDAVFTLAQLFVPGSAPAPCADSADSNDDGTLDISDAVFTLAALFVPGAPTPPVPFGSCGEDPTMDPLDCVNPFCP